VYSRQFFEDRAGEGAEGVVVHELAHQWTGDSLALSAWRDIWLNEGFATYAGWLWSEEEGTATAQEIFDFYARELPAADPFWRLRIGDPGPRLLLTPPVYDRGAMTLQALRRKLGDRAFFGLLRTWIRSNRGGHVRTSDFIALAERRSGQDLGAFFRSWLFTPSKPRISRSAGRGS
jgi:aminopeptidase N